MKLFVQLHHVLLKKWQRQCPSRMDKMKGAGIGGGAGGQSMDMLETV